jgi:hypothetical protein
LSLLDCTHSPLISSGALVAVGDVAATNDGSACAADAFPRLVRYNVQSLPSYVPKPIWITNKTLKFNGKTLPL